MQNEKHKKNQNHVTRSEITRAIISLDPENDARDRCVIVPFEWAQRMAEIDAARATQDIEMDMFDSSIDPLPHLDETPKRKVGNQGSLKPAQKRGGKRANVGRPHKDRELLEEDTKTRQARKTLCAVDGNARADGTNIQELLTVAVNKNSCISACCGVVGNKHISSECVRAKDMLVELCGTCNEGEVYTQIFEEGKETMTGALETRGRILLELSNGMTVKATDNAIRACGRKPARRARDIEMKIVWEEVDEIAQIKGLPGDIEGVCISVVQGMRILLADLESSGLMDAAMLPDVLEWRFSFDGTKLTNGGSLVVVAIVPMNLPVSCQSRSVAVPVALMKCGEDRELLKVALKGVLDEIERVQEREMYWHGKRKVVMGQSYDMASW